MAYIGKSPAVAALTASDITDGIISTAKIADNAVTEPKTAWNDIPLRNIVINGDFSVSQRATSTASITGSGYNTVDRFRTNMSSAGTWTQSQSTDVPTGQGFSKSFKMDNTTADASLSAGNYIIIDQRVEGQMLQYLKKGTSSAESLTLSFWVKSAKTGTYIAALEDSDNSRYIANSYTISSADTWEEKSVTFAGDTTGTFGNDNATSLKVQFWLAAGTTYTSGTLATSWESATNANLAVGQVNLADSTSNDWYVTGIQLEVGTVASNFEFLPFDVNLQRCQRYYYVFADKRTSGVSPVIEQVSVGTGVSHYGNQMAVSISMPVNMRTIPSVDQVSGTDYFQYYHDQTGDNFDSFNNISANGVTSMMISNTDNISATVGTCGLVYATNASAVAAFDAEL